MGGRIPQYIPPTYQKTLARLQQGELVRVPCADLEFSSYAAGAGALWPYRAILTLTATTRYGYNLQTGGSGLGTNIASLQLSLMGEQLESGGEN